MTTSLPPHLKVILPLGLHLVEGADEGGRRPTACDRRATPLSLSMIAPPTMVSCAGPSRSRSRRPCSAPPARARSPSSCRHRLGVVADGQLHVAGADVDALAAAATLVSMPLGGGGDLDRCPPSRCACRRPSAMPWPGPFARSVSSMPPHVAGRAAALAPRSRRRRPPPPMPSASASAPFALPASPAGWRCAGRARPRPAARLTAAALAPAPPGSAAGGPPPPPGPRRPWRRRGHRRAADRRRGCRWRAPTIPATPLHVAVRDGLHGAPSALGLAVERVDRPHHLVDGAVRPAPAPGHAPCPPWRPRTPRPPARPARAIASSGLPSISIWSAADRGGGVAVHGERRDGVDLDVAVAAHGHRLAAADGVLRALGDLDRLVGADLELWRRRRSTARLVVADVLGLVVGDDDGHVVLGVDHDLLGAGLVLEADLVRCRRRPACWRCRSRCASCPRAARTAA